MMLQDRIMIKRYQLLILLPLLFGACSQNPAPPPATAVIPSPSTLSQTDAAFATAAAQSSLFATEISKIAVQKAGRQGIRNFAQQIVDTQIASTTRLAAITQTKGLTLSPAPTSQQAAAIGVLGNTPDGSRFRRLYFSNLIRSHLTAARETEAFATTGTDPELKRYATDQTLLLRKQIAAARNLPTAVSPK